MTGIDRYSVFGCEIAVETDSPVVRGYVRRIYRRFAAASPPTAEALRFAVRAEDGAWTAWEGDRPLASSPSPAAAVQTLEVAICTRVMESRCDLVSIHGATVIAPRGGVLIIGDSGAGKSTLSLALAAHGFEVPADDLALVEGPRGVLSPVPRCFHLDARSLELLGATGLPGLPEEPGGIMTPSDLGSTSTAAAVVAIIHLTAGAGDEPDFHAISQAEMLALLCRDSGRGHASWEEALGVLARLVGGASCYSMARGELSRMVARVVAMVSE